MAEPSSKALRAALQGSFTRRRTPPIKKLGAARQPLAALLRVLSEDLRTPGDERKRKPLPRVALGAALWNLALRYLKTNGRSGDAAGIRSLNTLVEDVFGWNLAQLRAMRRDDIDPLLVLAGQYSIAAYRWTPPRSNPRTVQAKLELGVRYQLEELKAVIDPAYWAKHCGLFWADVVPTRSIFAARSETPAFDAKFTLPNLQPADSSRVTIECKLSHDSIGFMNEFTIRLRPPRAPSKNGPILCTGSIRAAKEQGRAWSTRITHEKHMSVRPGLRRRDAVDLLTYWMQTETVCLVLPN